jgi:membrane protease YdiL (CAAX protease family)
MLDALRTLAPPLLAVATAVAVDRSIERRGLTPPGFVPPPPDPSTGERRFSFALPRRGLALLVVAFALWVGVFLPIGMVGVEQQIDLEQLSPARLFLLHGIFTLTLAVWLSLGFGTAVARWSRQLGLRARSVARELALGAACGLAGWLVVLTVLIGVGLLLWTLGGPEMLPTEPPPMVPWLAALPLSLRAAVSLSAGVVEESFFRGFLQPRTGIAASTGLFVLAHLSYEQPLMLVGISLLSLLFAFLVRWRQSVWAAIAAHAVFDGIQLLVVIPWAMKMVGEGRPTLPVALF